MTEGELTLSIKTPGRTLVLGALALFLALRVYVIFFGYEPEFPDFPFFHDYATAGLGEGLRAYRDFDFSYPPLALPFTYLPYLFAKSRAAYGLALKLEMFLVECACLGVTWLIGRRQLGLSLRAMAALVGFFAVHALFLSEFLYDRLDLLLGLILLATIYLHGEGRGKAAVYLPTVFGFLIKIIPAFWLVPLTLMMNQAPGRPAAQVLKKAALDLLVCLGPALLFFAAYDLLWSDGGLLRCMLLHLERGVQLESTWGSVVLILNQLRGGGLIRVYNEYGAQDIVGSLVSPSYLAFSKAFGFVGLAGFLVWYGRLVLRRQQAPRRAFLSGSLALLLFVICTQRVLSPQFLSWILYAAALHAVAVAAWPQLALLLAIEVLTLVHLVWGWDFLLLPTWAPEVLAARNLALCVLAALVMRDCRRALA